MVLLLNKMIKSFYYFFITNIHIIQDIEYLNSIPEYLLTPLKSLLDKTTVADTTVTLNPETTSNTEPGK